MEATKGRRGPDVRNKTRPFVLVTQCPGTNETPAFPHQGIKHVTEPLLSHMTVPGVITKSPNITSNLQRTESRDHKIVCL